MSAQPHGAADFGWHRDERGRICTKPMPLKVADALARRMNPGKPLIDEEIAQRVVRQAPTMAVRVVITPTDDGLYDVHIETVELVATP